MDAVLKCMHLDRFLLQGTLPPDFLLPFFFHQTTSSGTLTSGEATGRRQQYGDNFFLCTKYAFSASMTNFKTT
jgi:hypothetical protein